MPDTRDYARLALGSPLARLAIGSALARLALGSRSARLGLRVAIATNEPLTRRARAAPDEHTQH